MNDLVSVKWLNENISHEDLILLDASLATTVQGDSSNQVDITIPGARFFDLKGKFSDKSNAFPNTYPSADQFESECRKLGINNSSKVVVFDNRGIYSSPRVWWLFKLMGHENVAVLDGGLPEWIKSGHETAERIDASYTAGDFKANISEHWVKSYDDIVDNLDTCQFQIVDARSAGRFEGIDPEPRKHLQSGKIGDSVNIPFKDLFEGGKFKSKKELKEIFEEKIPNDKPLVYSCGSGLTACIVMLASEIAFRKGKLLFDGSWTEWAERQGLVTEE